MTIKYSNNNDKDFSKMTDPVKKDKSFFCALGDSFMLKNEYRKAIKEYLVSLMIDKNNIYARKGASKAYKNLKEYDKAIKHLKNARNIYGFDSEIYYELGLNYLLNGNNESAQKNFKRTIKLCPDDKNAQVKLALTHELSGEEDMAILVYNTIIEKNPNYIPAL
ncbi:tetratricopeptide repeat protein [bacterium]|nr:tetratricopeptide repeat protein [bacterium]